MLIFTVEHRTREKLLQLLNGGSGDVIGEVGQVGRPQLRAQRLDRRFGHGWDAVLSAPLEDALLKKGNSRFWGNTLFLREPSARTATEGGSSGVREEPDRTQWSEDGLSAADRKADQLQQQHWGFLSRDHDSMAAL